jgi:hypothetical protein
MGSIFRVSESITLPLSEKLLLLKIEEAHEPEITSEEL